MPLQSMLFVGSVSACFMLLLVQVTIGCYTGLARNPKLTSKSTQAKCIPLNGTELFRVVDFGKRPANPCSYYSWSKSSEERPIEYECELNQLFNLDLCECWDADVVDSVTCRTKPGFNSSELHIEPLKKYNTTVASANCTSLSSTELFRVVDFGRRPANPCSHYSWPKSSEERPTEYECGLNQLFNLDLCECWDADVVDPMTCLTKPEFNSSELHIELLKKYNTTVASETCRAVPNDANSRMLFYKIQDIAGPCDPLHWKIHHTYETVIYREQGRCESNKVLNLDLCQCWDYAVVDIQTCRTKPEYDVEELWNDSFKLFNSSDFFREFVELASKKRKMDV